MSEDRTGPVPVYESEGTGTLPLQKEIESEKDSAAAPVRSDPAAFVQNHLDLIVNTITDSVKECFKNRNRTFPESTAKIETKTARTGVQYFITVPGRPKYCRNISKMFPSRVCRPECIQPVCMNLAENITDYLIGQSPQPAYPIVTVFEYPKPEMNTDDLATEIYEYLVDHLDESLSKWNICLDTSVELKEKRQTKGGKKNRRTAVFYELDIWVYSPPADFDNDPDEIEAEAFLSLKKESLNRFGKDREACTADICEKLLKDFTVSAYAAIRQKINERTEEIIDGLVDYVGSEMQDLIQSIHPDYHLRTSQNNLCLEIRDEAGNSSIFQSVSTENIRKKFRQKILAAEGKVHRLKDPDYTMKDQSEIVRQLAEEAADILDQTKERLFHPVAVTWESLDDRFHSEKDLFRKALLKSLLDMKSVQASVLAPDGIPNQYLAHKYIQSKETNIVFEAEGGKIRASVSSPVGSGIYWSGTERVEDGSWEKFTPSPTVAKRLKEQQQPLRESALSRLNTILGSLPGDLNLKRCTGDGLLSGSGDYEVFGPYERDPHLRRKLKTVPYWKDIDTWAADVHSFLKELYEDYAGFSKQEIIEQTRNALQLIDSFPKRDIVNVLANTPYMSLEVLTSFLAGEEYKTAYTIYHESELKSRYKGIYTSGQLQTMAQELDQKDVIRLSDVDYGGYGHYRHHQYTKASSLKAARKAAPLLDGTYEFSKEDLTAICKDRSRNLTDFEAEYLYKKAKAESNSFSSELPMPDYIVLTRTLEAPGFVAQYQSELIRNYSTFPSRIRTLIKTRIPSIQNKKLAEICREIASAT